MDDDTLIGRVLAGKFVIARLLGAGAMGAVYRAEQTALDRSVAIKVMHRGFAADPTYAARFRLEAKAASRLDHPNLIRVLDYGQEADGLLYIAMEYLDCRDLFTVLAEDWPLSHERIVDLLSQALSGLAEAHEAGVLHRDLKPENIMVVQRKGDEGRPVEVAKVGDFGIAKLVDPAGGEAARGEGRKLTTAGLVVGTPEYMSPEQARGEAFDARSDVYAVGVILYQLLTRRLPFQGRSSIEVVFKAMNEEPARLDSGGQTAAPGLDPVCLKAMSKRPEDRYQSAREMRAALRAAPKIGAEGGAVVGDVVRASQTPTQVEIARASRPSRWRARGGLAVIAAILVASGMVTLRRAAPSTAAAPPSPSAQPPVSVVPAVERAPHQEQPAPSAVASAKVPVASPPGVIATRSQPAGDRSPRAPRSRVDASLEAIEVPAPAPTPISMATPPPPVVTAAPVEPPPAPPSATAPTPLPPPPAFNVATARVELGQARSNNAAATAGNVNRALAPLAGRFTACFRSALAQGGGGGGEALATLHLESDDQGYVTVAHVSGATLPAAARCIEGLSRNVHIQVDTGTANADVPLTFEPL